ncbi:MAG: InlB B-repeat-containing protein, partial [Clostridia bacterium]|nr:InlB B-repeat-containing protein [Clostridia bacterium]
MSIAKRIISVVLAVIMAFGTMSVLGTVVSATHSFDSTGNTTLADGDPAWDAAFNPNETYQLKSWDDLMTQYNVPQDLDGNYMPWKVDPFFYTGIEVYEVDPETEEEELTDHYVQPEQVLALYFYFKSNVGIAGFTEAFLFDRTFFNINYGKKLTYKANNDLGDGLYNNGYYSGYDIAGDDERYNPDCFISLHQEFLDDGGDEYLGVTCSDGLSLALTNAIAAKIAPYSQSVNYYKINKAWFNRFDIMTVAFEFAEEQYHPSCLTTYDPVGILDDPDYTYTGNQLGLDPDPNTVAANGIDPDAWIYKWYVSVRSEAEPYQGSTSNTVNNVEEGTVGHFGFDPVVLHKTHVSNKCNLLFNPDPLGDSIDGTVEDKDYPGTVNYDFEDCNHTFVIGEPAAPGSTYTVTYDVDGGTAINPDTVNAGGSVTLPAAEKAGFDFLGWSADDDGTADAGLGANATYTPAGNVTLYAIFQEQVVNYTVTYVVDGGTAIPADTVAAGTSITLPTAVKDSLTFLGWSTENDGTADAGLGANATYTPAGNVTLYAIFAAPAAQYTVTFDANGGAPTPTAQTVADGTQITAPTAPSKDHATFRAWTINGADVTWPYTVTGDVTMVADYTAEQITVNFITGAGATTVDSVTVDYGTQINAPDPAPTKDNAVLAGWQINGADVTFPYTVTETVNMTAVWNEIYTVTFDANGGAPTPEAVSGVAGTTVTEPAEPSKEHATFNGWQINGADVTWPYTITGNVTMVADYTVDTYTITFSTPEGATAVTAITDDYGTVYNDGDLPASELLGNDFLGWQINGTDVAYPYTLTGDVTMTAAFAPATISISWVDTDNVAYSVDASYTSQVYGGNLAIPADPAAPAQGLTFRGWSEDGETFFKNGDTVAVPAT